MKATIKKEIGTGQSVARCGRCGQVLWRIQHNLPGGASELIEVHSKGYRYDADTGTWSPTGTERAKYSAAAHRILVNREQPNDRTRVRDSRFHAGRRMRPGMLKMTWTHAAEIEDALRLPTKIVCIRCETTNDVEVDLHSA